MRNILHIQTPENVILDFELAGVGTRGVAVAIDMLIQNVVLFIIAVIITLISGELTLNLMVIEDNTTYIVIALLLIFIMQFGYFLIFEYFMKGVTPGKKVVGLKSMMANGEPLSFTASLIRNFIRIADMLPGIYGIGIFSVVLSKRYMRVGDLAANTVVVKVKKNARSLKEPLYPKKEMENLCVTPKEEALLIEYRERKRDLKNPLYSEILESQLYHHFYEKIGLVPNLPNSFSKRVYLEKLMEHLGV